MSIFLIFGKDAILKCLFKFSITSGESPQTSSICFMLTNPPKSSFCFKIRSDKAGPIPYIFIKSKIDNKKLKNISKPILKNNKIEGCFKIYKNPYYKADV